MTQHGGPRRPKRVVQFVLGDAASDARVRRSAWALRDAGHKVLIVGRSRERWGLQALGPVAPIDGMEHWALPWRFNERYDALLDGIKDWEGPHRVALLARRLGLPRQITRVAGLFQRASHVLAALSAWSPDVIHAHDLFGFSFLAEAASAAGLPIIYDAHELEQGRNAPNWTGAQRRAHAELERSTIGLAQAVITVSPAIAQILADSYGIPRPTVVANAPPRAIIRSNTPLAQRLELPAGDRVVLYLGAITSGRGIERLLGALAQLPSHVHVAMMGHVLKDYRPAFEQRVEALGALRARLHLLGKIRYEDLIHQAWGADLGYNGIELKAPSYQNALPNKFFEYVFADVPVLSTPQTDPVALTKEYELGRIMPDGDVDQVTTAITSALQDELHIPPERRAEFITRYAWEAQAEALLALYERI